MFQVIPDSIESLICVATALLVALVLLFFAFQKSITTPYPQLKRYKKEKYYFDPTLKESFEFPSIDDRPDVKLSVIVPAYNEEQRLPKMLDECLDYLEQRAKRKDFTYEIIVVSDGSTDGTVELATKYAESYGRDKFRVLALVKNRGKGGAVRMGMLSARGEQLLFADADGATKFSDLAKLEDALHHLTPEWQKDGMAIGSRAHLEAEAIATRSAFRTFLMHGFHYLVWLFAVRTVSDTQCGYKLLTRASARKLFKIMHVEGWAFDVELLYLAESLKIPIEEVAVTWHEIEGSKLTPIWSWIQMGIDLFLIWFRYFCGAWRMDIPKEDRP